MSIEREVNMRLQAVYEKYQEQLRRLARAIGIAEGDIDDVVQETFIAYFENYSLTWTEEHQRAMLMKILKNKCIDSLRKASHYKQISLDSEEEHGAENAALGSAETDPLKVLLDEEAYQRLQENILNMRPEWKEMAVLYFMEEKSIKEICETLGISGTVCRSRIYRIRNSLRKVLGPGYSV